MTILFKPHRDIELVETLSQAEEPSRLDAAVLASAVVQKWRRQQRTRRLVRMTCLVGGLLLAFGLSRLWVPHQDAPLVMTASTENDKIVAMQTRLDSSLDLISAKNFFDGLLSPESVGDLHGRIVKLNQEIELLRQIDQQQTWLVSREIASRELLGSAF